MVFGFEDLLDGNNDDNIYLKVSRIEGEEFIELPKEDDNTILFTFVESQFPSTIGLKYRSNNGDWKMLFPVDGVLCPPKDGWGHSVYLIVVPTDDVNNNVCADHDTENRTEVQVKNKDQNEQPIKANHIPLASFLDNCRQADASQQKLKNKLGNVENERVTTVSGDQHRSTLQKSQLQKQQARGQKEARGHQRASGQLQTREKQQSSRGQRQNKQQKRHSSDTVIENEDGEEEDSNFFELASYDFPDLNGDPMMGAIPFDIADGGENSYEIATPTMTCDEKIFQLIEMFPDVPNAQLRRCLSRYRGNLQKAINAILTNSAGGYKKKEVKNESEDTCPAEIERNEKDISRLVEMFPRLSINRIRDRYQVVGKDREKAMKVIWQEEQDRANGYLGNNVSCFVEELGIVAKLWLN